MFAFDLSTDYKSKVWKHFALHFFLSLSLQLYTADTEDIKYMIKIYVIMRQRIYFLKGGLF